MKSQGEDNINVYLRIRPFNEKQQNTETILHSLSQKTIKIKDKQSEHEFSFDGIFNEKSTQLDIYDKVGKDLINAAFEGFNGTIFAYGQTSSGKTHTCIGPDYQDEQNKGLLPRLISHLFNKITEEPPYIEFRIKISMVQIYLQKIKDLLDISKTDIKIRENKSKGVYLQDATQEYVASTAESVKLFEKGITNRTVAQTSMNDVSSRSHMVFIITLHQNNLKDVSAKSGKIILVDLAGSQKVGKTGAEGKLLDEAKQINKSLLSLGNVINALTDPKTSHVPYRDSKLTRLLQESLGGNSKTRLIINISPSSYNYCESLSSLRFGWRAKQIKNKPRINREYTVAQLLILLEKAEKRIQELEKMLFESTSSKKKASVIKKQAFIQNLLDSDNPILSGVSQNEGQAQIKPFVKKFNGIKELKFQSQVYSDSQLEVQNRGKRQQVIDNKQIQNKNLNQQWQIERNQLLQMIKDLTFDKNQSFRQVEIFEEKYEIAAKQARIYHTKVNSIQKQNQKLLEKVVTSKLETQEKEAWIEQLQQKIQSYQDSIKEMIASHDQDTKMSKIFGVEHKQQDAQTNKLIQKYQRFHDSRNKHEKQQVESKLQGQQTSSITELKRKICELEEDLLVYKNLEESKDRLVKEKIEFVGEKQKVYKDLQNRIQKVLQLEEQLDESREVNKFLEELLNTEQSERGRKIKSMQRHIDQLSENYFVLKGQQSSWINNNKRYEKKMEDKDKKIKKLEQQIIQLKGEIQILQTKQTNEFNEIHENDQLINLDFQITENEPKRQGKIVKVLKSFNTCV